MVLVFWQFDCELYVLVILFRFVVELTIRRIELSYVKCRSSLTCLVGISAWYIWFVLVVRQMSYSTSIKYHENAKLVCRNFYYSKPSKRHQCFAPRMLCLKDRAVVEVW